MRASALSLLAGLVAASAVHCSSGGGTSPPSADAGADGGQAPPPPRSDAGGADGGASPRDAGAPDAAGVDARRPSDGGSGVDARLPGWTLTWSDEFNEPAGTAPNPAYWSHDVGGDGWGNNELEYYTSGSANTYEEGGNLVIVATTAGASAYTCANDGAGGACQYTSGRLVTESRDGSVGFSQTYGRFEARMKLPGGAGLWPAFWMLGTNIETVNWPACGEVDVMENLGQAPATTYGHLHMPQAGGGDYGPGTGLTLEAGTFDDGFHVFAVEWSEGEVDFFVDDTKYDSITSASDPSNATWAFDGHPFFVVLNLAVGSKDSWPGAPTAETKFPAKVLVDYVRVYSKE